MHGQEEEGAGGELTQAHLLGVFKGLESCPQAHTKMERFNKRLAGLAAPGNVYMR